MFSKNHSKKLGLEAMNLVMGREREERGGAHTMDERRRRSNSHRGRSGRHASGHRSPVAEGLEPPTYCCGCA